MWKKRRSETKKKKNAWASAESASQHILRIHFMFGQYTHTHADTHRGHGGARARVFIRRQEFILSVSSIVAFSSPDSLHCFRIMTTGARWRHFLRMNWIGIFVYYSGLYRPMRNDVRHSLAECPEPVVQLLRSTGVSGLKRYLIRDYKYFWRDRTTARAMCVRHCHLPSFVLPSVIT